MFGRSSLEMSSNYIVSPFSRPLLEMSQTHFQSQRSGLQLSRTWRREGWPMMAENILFECWPQCYVLMSHVHPWQTAKLLRCPC